MAALARRSGVRAPRAARRAGGRGRGRVVAARAGAEDRKAQLDAKLAEALAIAEACKDDCAADWDAVEEISAAAADTKAVPDVKDASISPEAKDFIMKTQAAIAESQAGTTVSVDTLRMLDAAQAAAASIKEEEKKADPRLPEIEAKLAAALEDAKACEDDCAAEWDTVEELSATAADMKK